VVNANPDGYTLLQTGNAAAISASLFKKLPFNVLKDFQQVSTVAFFELVVLATPQSRLTTLGELLAFGRQNPGKLDIGTINVGSTQYLAAELFKSMTGVQAQTVPFKSNTLLLTALRGNELGVAFELVGPALAHIRSGALKALAVGSERRFPGLPEVPTIAEAGVPGYSVYSWTGISVPARTPRPIVERLAREVAAAVAVPEVRQRLQDIGIVARASSPDETRQRMVSDIAKWKAVIERAGIARQ
jgi:tripartite-type tricarboxylate transporter receptor subunit TctC